MSHNKAFLFFGTIGTMQRKQVVGSKLGAPGAGPLKATGLSRPGGNKTTQRLTPKERKMIFSLP